MKITNEIKVVLIVLGVILIGYFAQKYFADELLKKTKAQYNVRIDRLRADSSKLKGRTDQLTAQLATKEKERAQRDQKFTEALAKTQSDVNRIAQWAESLDISRQIGEIAKKLPKPLQGDSTRIQKGYAPADVAIIKELYKRIQEGQLYKSQYETATQQVTDYRADNDTLKQHIAAYKRGYTLIHERLLTIYEQRAFLNIGLGKEVLQIAKQVGRILTDPTAESDMEKTLNGPAH